MNSNENKSHLYVTWMDKLPSQARNVWRVNGNIDFHDGKAIFQIANGSIVKIDVGQLRTIGITGNAVFYDKE